MANYHATAEGPVQFTAQEEIDWAAEQAAMTANALPNSKARFIKQNDDDVDAIIRDVAGERTGEYLLAETQAQAYITAGYSGVAPTSVTAWANATGKTPQWAADDIMATATGWRSAQASIRATRLSSKEAAKNAASIEALDAIKSSWAAYLSGIRSALGI